ncbi:AraC-type DNA-binding protein [Arthrobacter sp. ok909]|uniref:helix-turn-helix domain-containing protein n=1 Tax=Arthrobacter sp. ok909 TaxID=1761746 RepID=UPI000889D944|nr:helix-turn-helix domain-containing protein [Arthrobacter sp. ok909]SDP82041.1 AraC-type DNA-binding protein [Arthrobacter sp. ok909]
MIRFSTAGVPEPRRVELWENHNARSLIGLGCRTLNDASLEATEYNLLLPGIQFAHVAANPHVVERTRRHISATPADAVVVYFNLDGEAFFYHRDGCELLRPGQAILHDADQPFMRGFSHGLRELALKVPRPVFREISGRNSVGKPRVFEFGGSGAANSHACALVELMKSALATQESDGERVESAALGLLRVLINGAGGDDGLGHFSAAKAFIAQRFRDPRLSAAQIAAAVGISERQLSPIFAGEGISVARFILNERLEAARRSASAPNAARQPLGQLAASLGFSSQAHFSRAYKDRFGITPLQGRQYSAAGH